VEASRHAYFWVRTSATQTFKRLSDASGRIPYRFRSAFFSPCAAQASHFTVVLLSFSCYFGAFSRAFSQVLNLFCLFRHFSLHSRHYTLSFIFFSVFFNCSNFRILLEYFVEIRMHGFAYILFILFDCYFSLCNFFGHPVYCHYNA
jgi:hypothetical protein